MVATVAKDGAVSRIRASPLPLGLAVLRLSDRGAQNALLSDATVGDPSENGVARHETRA